jgi:hypothetical protein
VTFFFFVNCEKYHEILLSEDRTIAAVSHTAGLRAEGALRGPARRPAEQYHTLRRDSVPSHASGAALFSEKTPLFLPVKAVYFH